MSVPIEIAIYASSTEFIYKDANSNIFHASVRGDKYICVKIHSLVSYAILKQTFRPMKFEDLFNWSERELYTLMFSNLDIPKFLLSQKLSDLT